jgi:hypothetical protein
MKIKKPFLFQLYLRGPVFSTDLLFQSLYAAAFCFCVSKVHYDKIKSYLNIAVEEGGTILTGEGVDRPDDITSCVE